MADKFGGQKDGRQTTGATFYDVPAVPVNANALYFPNFPASPFFGVAEYPVAAGDLGAFSTSGVFVFDKPVGWIDNPGRKVFYRPKTAATGEIVAQEIKGDVFIGYQIIDNINPQKLGVLLASPEFCMNVLIVTSTADSGAGSLRQAIADAADGDVILFDSDVFPAGQTTSILLSSYLPINKSVSIYGGFNDGNGGYTSGAEKRYYVYREIDGVKTKVYIDDDNPSQEGETVLFENVCRVALDGQGTTRSFAISSSSAYNPTVDVAGIEFIDGLTPYYGGAIQVAYSSTVVLSDCNFVNCNANYGGALGLQGESTNYINNCYFASCTSTIDGGVLSIANASQAIFNNCIFDNNQGKNGGVFRCTDTAITNINRCIITGCSATGSGCAYLVGSSQNTLNDCVFIGCSATNGGGVYSTSTSQNTLNNCTISGCSATNGGGVYSTSTSQNTLNNCNITDCSATSNAGGFYSSSTNQSTLNDCTFDGCSASNAGAMLITNGGTIVDSRCKYLTDTDRISVISTSVYIINKSELYRISLGDNANVIISNDITTVRNINTGAATFTINDGAVLTITDSATIAAATFTSAGRGYLATAAGIDISSATLTNVVACSYGAGLETFDISADGASWTAQDLTTPILIETRDAGGDWQTLTDDATGGEYATTFALESTARAFDGVAFFVATLPGYWQADAGAVDANDWSVKGFAAANSNGGGDAQGDAAQGWTVTPSTVTPNADGV